MAVLDTWGALRYAANTAFAALVYSDTTTDATRKARYHDFAVRQINYALGDNPRNSSYVIGFGANSAAEPAPPHRARLLVGQPDRARRDPARPLRRAGRRPVVGQRRVHRQPGDYVMNEVATDYNAGFTSALARLYQEYGGTPLANFPPAETPDIDELTVETTVTQAEPRATGLKAIVYNKSAFPARALTDGKFRYYFRPDGTGPVAVTAGYTQGCPSPTTAKQFSGNIWYVEVDCTGHTIAPAGQSQHRMEVQFKVGVPRGRHLGPDQRPVVPGHRRAEPEGAALLRRHPGLGRGARPGRTGHHRADRPRHPAASAVTTTGSR